MAKLIPLAPEAASAARALVALADKLGEPVSPVVRAMAQAVPEKVARNGSATTSSGSPRHDSSLPTNDAAPPARQS